MKNLVLCITLNFLFFISFVYSVETQPSQVLYFPSKSSINLTLTCDVSGINPTAIEWFKDSKKISDVSDLKNRHQLQNKNENLVILSTTDGDAGNYSCIAYQGAEAKATNNFTVLQSKTIAVKVPTNVNVVEEERLRIECKVVGDPVLVWLFENELYTESRNRVKLENYTDDNKNVIRNGIFIVEKITEEDRGEVACIGIDLYTNTNTTDKCMVRVKGKYAALWPFLGICAEVIVLCAIIVIYEKKRNKTELEESDTDQSPDQKNTPDHGKEANLRHRQ